MKTPAPLPLLAFFACLLAACDRQSPAPAASAHPPLTIPVNYWPGMYWVDIARDKDWFRAAGLAVSFVDTSTDYVASLADVAAGRLDCQGFTLYDLLVFNSRGSDLVMIVCTDQSTGADGIIARAGIERLADLRGKRLGIPKESYSEYIAAIVLARERIGDDDFIRVDIKAENSPAELSAGTVDAIVTWEPYLSEAARAGGRRPIWDSSQLPGISPAGIALRRALVRQRPAEIQALVRVWQRATDFLLQHPEEACAIVARAQKKTPAEVRAFLAQDKVLNLRESLAAFSYAAGFESLHGTARVMNDYLIRKNITATRLDSVEFLDPRFLKTLK